MTDGYFYTIVGAVVTGAILGPVGYLVSLSFLGLFALVGAALFIVVRRNSATAPAWLWCVPIFLLVLSCMLVRVQMMPSLIVPPFEEQLGREVTLEGVITREPEMRETALHLYVATEDTTVLVTTDRLAAVSYGDTVTVTGTLKEPEAFATDVGRMFNYKGYLAARGVGYTMSFAEVSVVASDGGNPVVTGLLEIKFAFMNNIEGLIPAPHVGLAEGLLLGVKRALGETYEEAFRETGIMHIVVLSGYNIMLVVSFFMYVLAYVLPYRARLITGMLGIAGFALLVGLSATVVRASVMASLLLLMKFGGMTHHILRALFVAGVAMLFLNPLLLLYDVGFQLSFLATFALIVLAPYVEQWFQWVPNLVGTREFLVATVTTQIFVTPLIMYHIGEVSLIAVVVNVLVLPMVAVAMLLTFVTGVLAFVSQTLAIPVAYAAYVSLSYILVIATTFAAVPFASVTIPPFSVTYMLGFYGVAAFAWFMFTRQKKSLASPHPSLGHLKGWTIVAER